jgi:transcriptional regulator GlxA family with amidase domain
MSEPVIFPRMDPRVKAVISLMHQRLADRLSLQILCKSVNLSVNRLQQLFKRETGRSPVQYLKSIRLQRAAQLLQTTFLSIKEVGYLTTGTDLSHFVRDFKKQYGLTPGQFRSQKQLSLENQVQPTEAHE